MGHRGEPRADLRSQAERFAARLTNSVHAVAPGCEPFRALVVESPKGERVDVRQEPDTGVGLRVNGSVLLTLKVRYECSWDRAGMFLAVDESSVKVYAGAQASGEPLFRYEYVRRPGKDLPGAHMHVHAHRDAMTFTMSRVGDSTARARRRADSSSVPRMDELHFPLGGPRFRPCLEDILEMLVCELGVECSDAGRRVLADERERWRRSQIRTAVRDAPSEAAEVLKELKFRVKAPRRRAPADNAKRLREH